MTENIPQLKVNNIVSKLTKAYTSLINENKPLNLMPSVMLWGAPGIGKSQLVRELADELKDTTGKKVVVTDVRLILFNPVDLRGIPTANADKTLAVWLKPKIFDMDTSPKVINILFLDEISAAPQSVQAAAYQITLDRIIGEHRLPDNCIVIAAGNRVTDKSVAYKMPRALANRLMHFEVVPDFSSWFEWAVSHNVNSRVIGFLSFRRDYLYESDTSRDDLAFTTPRTWEMVSNIFNNISDDVAEVYPMISGLVGCAVASELRSWCNIYHDLPNIEDIFKGRERRVPKQVDQLYALASSMIVYCREHKDDQTAIANSVEYAIMMPPEFTVIVLQGYQNIDKELRVKLLRIPAFVRWMETRGRLLNGNI